MICRLRELCGVLYPARAHRAAAFLHACSGINNRLPHMALGTVPPYFLAAARRHHLGRKASVQFRMPLRRNFGGGCGQIIETLQHLSVFAIGAIRPELRPMPHNGAVFMALFALPPNIPVAERSTFFLKKLQLGLCPLGKCMLRYAEHSGCAPAGNFSAFPLFIYRRKAIRDFHWHSAHVNPPCFRGSNSFRLALANHFAFGLRNIAQ